MTKTAPLYFLPFTSILIALMLSVVGFPVPLQHASPDWILLIVLYWSQTRPVQISLTTVWCAGILQDALQGTLLGQHALMLVLLAWIMQSCQRYWHLANATSRLLYLSSALLAQSLFIQLVNGLTGAPPTDATFLYAIPFGIGCWFLFYNMMDYLVRIADFPHHESR